MSNRRSMSLVVAQWQDDTVLVPVKTVLPMLKKITLKKGFSQNSLVSVWCVDVCKSTRLNRFRGTGSRIDKDETEHHDSTGLSKVFSSILCDHLVLQLFPPHPPQVSRIYSEPRLQRQIRSFDFWTLQQHIIPGKMTPFVQYLDVYKTAFHTARTRRTSTGFSATPLSPVSRGKFNFFVSYSEHIIVSNNYHHQQVPLWL